MGILSAIASILLVIGALNWGLVGLFKVDLVNKFLGEGLVARIIYILIGLSGIYAILYSFF